jgi:hypothetical protein
MTTTRPIPVPWPAGRSGQARPAWCSRPGGWLLFLEPDTDGLPRNAEDPLQAAQGTAFLISLQNLLALRLGIAVGLRIVATAAVAVFAPIALFTIVGVTIAHQIFTVTVTTFQDEGDHVDYLLSSHLICPLPFWLSLIPFVTGWMGENHFAPLPTAVYGVVMLAASIAYYILQAMIIAQQGTNSKLKAAVGKDIKGKLSPLIYIVAIALAFVNQWISDGLYVLVALMWLIPDRRIESQLNEPVIR